MQILKLYSLHKVDKYAIGRVICTIHNLWQALLQLTIESMKLST